MLASKLKYAMLPLPTTVPYSLFSKMMITMCLKSGTSGAGVGVASRVGVRVGAGVKVGDGSGATVGGKGASVDSAAAGWQAAARIETQRKIHQLREAVFKFNPQKQLAVDRAGRKMSAPKKADRRAASCLFSQAGWAGLQPRADAGSRLS